jgi:uncharacterized protein (TIGR00661 family)
MKVLYAFQGTGNGHIARAQQIIPILKKHATVDTLISGHQSQLCGDFDIDFQHRGISLLYNKTGGLSYKKIIAENDFKKTVKLIREIDLQHYDLIINDYEPITAWASKIRGFNMIEMSHQAALSFAETPKPKRKEIFGNLFLKHYAPSKIKIGFHFENYHSQIKKPVIREKIRNLNPERNGFYIVYLPSFSDENIIKLLSQVDVQWKVFSKYTKTNYRINNIEIFPVGESVFLSSFELCEGILCNAGFEGPAEALFLNKKLFVIPIHRQYEQECNAFALQQMGIPTSKKLDIVEIQKWVNSEQNHQVFYPNDVEETILKNVLSM